MMNLQETLARALVVFAFPQFAFVQILVSYGQIPINLELKT